MGVNQMNRISANRNNISETYWLNYFLICANIRNQSISSAINVNRMVLPSLKEVFMESIKPDSTLSVESISRTSFNKTNQKDGFQVLKNLETVDSDSQKNPIDGQFWIIDGLAFPKDTKFRGKYKGYFYYGKVSDGALMMNGREFLSPCAAAMAITRSSIDGWLFWDCKTPKASSWTNIHTLKQIKNNEKP
jgi:hypothetical protein